MQQRQLRLGDILDDYCPRERRVTNHAVVAMVGDDVKQTRCTTCDTEHEYKHAKVPRQRKRSDTPAALYAQVAANAPKRVAHEHDAAAPDHDDASAAEGTSVEQEPAAIEVPAVAAAPREEPAAVDVAPPVQAADAEEDGIDERVEEEEGPVHRPLIRASLPRPDGQQPPQRPIPEFTIRQPGGRQNRFRPRHQRGGHPFQANRSNGNMPGPMRGPRPNAGRPGMMKRHGPPGRKRSK
jgi:hypothetical protein